MCVASGCTACTGATVITAPGGRYTATLVPHVEQGTCGGAGPEAYFTFTLASVSDVFLATHMSMGVNTVLYVRSCGCTGTQIAGGCNTDADGQATSRLTLTNLAAGTYHVFVDTVSGTPIGPVTLDAYITTPGVPGDRCGNPTFIPAGTTSIAGDTCTVPGDDETMLTGTPSCLYVGNGNERIYYFFLPTARSVTFSGCGGTTVYDSLAYVRTVCTDEAGGSQVACDDDGCGGAGGSCANPTWRSTFTQTLGPGLFYFLADGFGSAGGSCNCGLYTYAITGL